MKSCVLRGTKPQSAVRHGAGCAAQQPLDCAGQQPVGRAVGGHGEDLTPEQLADMAL